MVSSPGWKLSFIPYYMTSTAKWRSPTVDEAIRVLKRAGYDGVEWMLGQHFNDASDLRSLVGLTRASGLEVSNIMCWQDLVTKDRPVRKERVKRLQGLLAAAGGLDIPVMNVFTGPMTWNADSARLGRDISEGEAWDAVVESLSSVVDAAEKHGVVVTVEPVFGMVVHDYYTLKELLGRLDSPYLAVNLDPSHFALYGNDTAWAVRMLGDKVRHVHVKDAFGRPGVFGETFTFPFLGEGIVDWKAFFGALKGIDYRGYLSLEFENDGYLNNVCDGDWAKAAVLLRERAVKLLPRR
jgi:sugar phosphate isomerase/epimerase